MKSRGREKAMENVPVLIHAGGNGERLHPMTIHSAKPSCIYLFNASDIIYVHEFMDENMKKNKCWHRLRVVGGLRVNPWCVVAALKVAEVK
jgi:hypothetical protein